MITFNNICAIIVLLLLVYLIALEFKPNYYSNFKNLNNEFEGFANKNKNNPSDTFQIKKTMKFRKVYSCKSYTIWIPVHIDNYFPVYQICCKGNTKPDKEAILVQEDPKGKDLPKDYEFVGVTKDNVSIWKPLPKKGFVSIGHVFSKKKPSKFAIRCVREKYTITDKLKNVIVTENSIDKQKYSLWSGFNSASFLCSDLNGNSVPSDDLYYIKDSVLNVEESLEMKLTTNYERLFEKQTDKKHLSIWKPIPPKRYRCIGLIAVANGVDPNGVLQTPVVHKKHCRKPIDYGEKYFGKLLDGKDKIYTFWKPTPPSGYGCLSNIIVKDVNEPEETELIYCVSLDYLKSSPYSRNMIWNNLPDTHNLVSVWTNNNDFFHASTDLNNPKFIDFSLDMNFITVDRDVMDLSKDIIAYYKLNPNNTDIYDEVERENLIKNTLSSRFDISDKRLENVTVDETKKEIHIRVVNREHNSGQITVNDFINSVSTTLDKDPIKIYNKNKNNFISKLTGIQVIYSNIEEVSEVPLDTSNFQDTIYE